MSPWTATPPVDVSWTIHGLGTPGVRLPGAKMVALAESILKRAQRARWTGDNQPGTHTRPWGLNDNKAGVPTNSEAVESITNHDIYGTRHNCLGRYRMARRSW